MFGRRTQERLQALQEAVERLEERISSGAQDTEQSVKHLTKTVQKHDMELEDLLESWEDGSARERELEQRARAAEEQNEKLKELICAVLTQYSGLRRVLLQDPAWQESLAAMERQLRPAFRSCGLTVTGNAGEEADPRIMEILSVAETDDPAKDRTVAEVYRPGLTEGQKIYQKAQVAAFRLKPKVQSEETR